MDEVEELLQELEDIDTFLSFGVLFPALSSTVNVPLEKQEKKEEQEEEEEEEKTKISVPPPPKLRRQTAKGKKEKELEFRSLLEELEDIERTLDFGVKLNTNNYAEGEYEGEVNRNGTPDGQGTMTWPDGGRYEGEWRNGNPHGQGTITFTDGRIYEGSVNNGNAQGARGSPSRGFNIEGEGQREASH